MEEAVKNLTLEELKEKFLLLLDIAKCAVCLESGRQDMVQCVNGHLLCSDCKADLNSCPTCHGRFCCTKPSHFVSQVIDILPTRCKYRNCTTIIRNDDDDHEKYCGFKPTNCKLCSWKGPGKELFYHCQNSMNHGSTSFGNRLLRNFSINKTLSAFSTFPEGLIPQDLFFWEEILNDPYTKTFTVKWHVVPNGKPTCDYFITLSLKSKSGPFTETKIKLNLDPDGPSEDNSISIPHRILSYFIDEMNTMSKPYSVILSLD